MRKGKAESGAGVFCGGTCSTERTRACGKHARPMIKSTGSRVLENKNTDDGCGQVDQMVRDMTLRQKMRATSSPTNNEKNKRDRTRVLDAHWHLARNDYLTEIIPGVILLSNGSQQNQCLVRNTGATAPMILSSRPSATLGAITRTDSAAFEGAGRFKIHLVASCNMVRHPLTSVGDTLLRAFSGVHVDGQSTARRPVPRAANRKEEFQPS